MGKSWGNYIGWEICWSKGLKFNSGGRGSQSIGQMFNYLCFGYFCGLSTPYNRQLGKAELILYTFCTK